MHTQQIKQYGIGAEKHMLQQQKDQQKERNTSGETKK